MSLKHEEPAESSALEEATTTKALWTAENLSFPSVQVVVMNANMGCIHCQQRVSSVIYKMDGLLDCVVDLHTKEITVRGVTSTKKRRTIKEPFHHHIMKKKVSCSFSFSRLICLNKIFLRN